MRRAMAAGALGATLWLSSSSFAQTGVGASRAATRAMPTMTEEEAEFDETVLREAKVIAFTRRLAAEQEARDERAFDEGVERFVKLSQFMRTLEEQKEAQAAADFEARLALSSKVQEFMHKVLENDLHRTLAPEPIDWIRTRPAPSR